MAAIKLLFPSEETEKVHDGANDSLFGVSE